MQKIIFLLLKLLKNTSSAQLCTFPWRIKPHRNSTQSWIFTPAPRSQWVKKLISAHFVIQGSETPRPEPEPEQATVVLKVRGQRSKGQKVRGSKGQRSGVRGQRVKRSKALKVKASKSQRVKGSRSQMVKRTEVRGQRSKDQKGQKVKGH